jgi:hypothetical protein
MILHKVEVKNKVIFNIAPVVPLYIKAHFIQGINPSPVNFSVYGLSKIVGQKSLQQSNRKLRYIIDRVLYIIAECFPS